jgi:protein TonB
MEYPKRVLKSLLIGVAIIASILAIPYLSDLFKKEKVSNYTAPVEQIVEFVDIKDDEKVIPPDVTQTTQEPAGPTEAWTAPLIVDFTTDTLPTARDIKNPGAFNSDGDPNAWGIPCNGCPEDVGKMVDIEKKVYPYYALEQKPEYVGGEEAMWQFLRDNLVYPRHAKEISLEGKVYVTFVINEFGTVTNVQVPREIGGGLDEEALRVVKMMPRWKPGKQAGHPVSVSYQLPIIFTLN